MKLRDRYKPYVRRANGREKAESLRDKMNLVYHRILKKPFYVMVQRGFPNLIIGCGETKARVQRGPITANFYGFKNWATLTKHHAQGVMTDEQQAALRQRIHVACAGKRCNRKRAKRRAAQRRKEAAA